MRKLTLLSIIATAAMFMISCGGAGYTSSTGIGGTSAAMVPVTMSVQDAPPTGVAVVSFEVQITSASLHNSGANTDVALIAKPAEVELEHLQSEPALLGALNVPAGTYSSVTATFANPRMIIYNNTAAPITVGAVQCAVKTTCKLAPTLNPATTTVSAAPFPITLAANSPLGFLLHFDVNSSVSTDLSTITPTIDLKELVPSSGVIHLEHLAGTITGISAPNFTLQPGLGGPMPLGLALPPVLNIATNGSTVYNFSDELQASCTTKNFACLATGQTVKVTVNVLTDGSLLATAVTLFEQNSPALEGTVVNVNPTAGQFKMSMMGGQWLPNAVPNASAAVGALVTVSVTSSTVYEIDTDGVTIPTGLTFAGIDDITVGQTVEVQVQPSAVASPVANSLTLPTNRVRLDESQVTAAVSTTSPTGTPPSFVLTGLPPLFGTGATMNVLTVPTTHFSNNITGGVAGLNKGDTVSAGGLLFNTTSGPALVAEKVLKRVQCSATSGTGTTVLIPCVM